MQLADREIADDRRRNTAQSSAKINNAKKIDAFTMEKIFVFFQRERLPETKLTLSLLSEILQDADVK